MNQTNTQPKQRGFFAVGLGLALTALFGATAITIEHTAFHASDSKTGDH